MMASDDPPHGPAAIVCAQTDGEGLALDRWCRHVDRLKGRFVTGADHQALAVFESPLVAVACAAAVQAETKRHSDPVAERIGIDYGEVVETNAGPAGETIATAIKKKSCSHFVGAALCIGFSEGTFNQPKEIRCK